MGGGVGGRRLHRLLPALHHRPSGAADRQAAGMGGGRGRGGSGLRRPDGAVLHGLPPGPAGLLLLYLRV